MKRTHRRLLAWVLVLALLLTGCRLRDGKLPAILRLRTSSAQEDVQAPQPTTSVPMELPTQPPDQPEEPTLPQERVAADRFEDMQYRRPDMEALELVLQESCRIARSSEDIGQVMDGVYRYYDAYDWFYTDYALADIHYSCDLSDPYWEEEYQFCLDHAAQVDEGLDRLYRALAESPIRRQLEGKDYFGKDFFSAYEDEGQEDERLLQLREQENELISRYYTLQSQALRYPAYSERYYAQMSQPMTALLVEMILLRQQIAEAAGYESYPQYAYESYYERQYDPRQTMDYLQQLQQVLVPLYCRCNEKYLWEFCETSCTQQQTFSYVQTAAQNMGGCVEEAFRRLEEGQLYHIQYGENKMEGAFEIFLWGHGAPFVFVSPYEDQSDMLTFAHEFGHFANDHLCQGSYVGTDVAEVQSQAMEYLSLLYADAPDELIAYKMYDSLCAYVEQAAYSLFELRVYELEPEDVTVEAVQALYEEVGEDFGFESFGWDSRDLIGIEHFYTMPMYVIGYVVSNDLAMQLYQKELEQTGAGVEAYLQCLESQQSDIMEFAKTYHLESPFAPGRLEHSRSVLETGLQPYL